MITTKKMLLLASLLLALPATFFAQFGSGNFGPYTVFGPGEVINQYTAVVDVNAATREIESSNSSLFFPGSKALLIQMEGGVPGTWEFVHVVQTTANTVRVLSIQRSYDAFTGKVQLVTIPEYSDLYIPSGTSLVPLPWNGFTGGVVCCMVSGTLTIDAGGFIDASGTGFQSGMQGFGGVGGQGGAGGIAPAGNGGAIGLLGNAIAGGGSGAEYGLPAILPTSPSQPNCPGCAAGSTNTGNINANLLVMGGCGFGGNGGNGSDGAGGGGAGAHGLALGLDGTPGGSGGTGGDGGLGGAGGGVILISARTLDLPQQECMLANGMSALSGGLAGNGGSGGDGGLGGDGCNTGGSGGGGGGADGANGGDGGNGGAGGMIKIIRGNTSPAPQSFHRAVNGGFGAIGGAGGQGGTAGSNGPLRGLLCGGGTAAPIPVGGGGCNAGQVLTFLQSIGATGNNSGVYTSLGAGLHQYVSGADTVFIQELASQEVFVRARFGVFDYYTLIVGSSNLPDPWGIVHEIFTQGNVLFFNTIVTTLTNANGTYNSECPIFIANLPPNGNNGNNGADGLDGGPGSVGDETAADCNDDPIYVMVMPVVPYTCPESPGEIQASVISGGSAPYTFTYSSFSSFQQNTTGSFTVGNEAGEVIAVDANGCISSPEYAMPDVQITEDWAVATVVSACPGGVNGAVTLFVDSLFGQLPLQQVGDLQSVINLSNGSIYFPVFTSAYVAVFTGLPAGSYQVVQTQCSDDPVVTFEILEDSTSSALLAATIQNISCFGSSNGSIDITVTGGNAPYAYTWSSGASTEDIGGLNAGNYVVQVTDAGGCSVSQSYVLNAPPLLEITGYTTPDVCGNSNGSISITATGGSGPFSYLWSNGQTTEGIINVPAGSYSVVVTDSAQCSNTATFTVSGPSAPLISIGFNVTADCGGIGGNVDLIVGSQDPIASYQWSTGSNAPQLVGVPSGMYFVVVTDVNGCFASKRVFVPAARTLRVSGEATAAYCSPANSGAINLTVDSGTPGYSYSWSNGAFTEDLSNVPAGVYFVTVRDTNNCETSATFEVGDGCLCPVNFNAEICGPTEICQGESLTLNSVVRPRAQGFPVTYSWTRSPGTFAATTASITQTGLTAGTYTYVLVVSYSPVCSVTVQHTVTVRPRPTVTVTNALTGNNTTATQLAGCDIVLNATGGVYYNWTYNGVTFPSHTSPLVDSNTAISTSTQLRTYGVMGVDQYGCSNTASIQVRLTRLTVTGTYSTAPAGPNVTVSGNVPTAFTNATYSWTGPGGFFTTPSTVVRNFSRINLLPALLGTYTVSVTQNGCTKTASFQLSGDGVVTLLPLAPNGTSNYTILPETDEAGSAERDDSTIKEESLTFELFPNPTTDLLRITGEASFPVYAIVRIFDFNGQLVYDSTQGEKQQFNEVLDVSTLAPGNYVLMVDCGSGGIWSERFTKL